MQSLKTILVATDFSDLSDNAFHGAYALARAHQARLIVLYVKQPQEMVQGEFGVTPPEPEETDEELVDRLDALVPDDSTIEVETIVMHGDPAATIVQVAKDRKCDLIVMGTHDRKGLARFFYGNVADAITREAPCPVMALRGMQSVAE